MRIHGGGHAFGAGLHLRNEFHQTVHIVRLRESFFLHQPTFVQHLIRVQETVGGDQFNAAMLRPIAK
ncbi:hypothetical protein D3C80_1969850 [compost metagenome]